MRGRRGPGKRLSRFRGLASGAVAIAAAACVSAMGRPASPAGGDWTQGGPQLASRGTVVSYPSGRPDKADQLPKVKASAFIVANAGSGQVLAARDPHGWYRPASTLKMLTAISLIPLLNPDATTVASHQAATVEPNDVGLIAGRSYPISGLFTALLTISANDAAVALAQATGSLRTGMAVINAEAHQLQADDTVAEEPDGLDAAGQHTSAYDEALIARRALAMPAFLRYDQTRAARFERKPRRWVTLVNQNLMLTGYRGDIGGKLGWTSAAGATYVGMAERNGVTLIVTLLHCPALTEFSSATRLLNWGFAENGKVTPVGTLVSPLPPQAAGKPAAKTAAHPADRTVASRGSSLADPAVVGELFLLFAGLIVAGFVTWRRHQIRRGQRSRQARAPGASRPQT
ncbi:MAG TPA: D-alanyl-D-alanine carboxypeptidase [Streptosporangiaceae bacterium]